MEKFGSGMEEVRAWIRHKHPRSGSIPLTNVPRSRGAKKHTDPDSGCTVYRQYSVADLDPGSVAFLTLGSRIRDPGWVKSLDPDPG
jgi:hypothetical protein